MTKKFIPLAKKVIDLEIQALQKLKKKIDNSFNKAVVEIAKCKSKVILCGVGKSGLIAAKISATLSSVGTPSLIYQQVTPLMVIWEVFQKRYFNFNKLLW
jgi:arabinose-5-phosphate isomerase